MDHDEENTQIFLEVDFVNKIMSKIEIETKNGLLCPVSVTTDANFTLADEQLPTLVPIAPPIHPFTFRFLFLNEFCITMADFPSTHTEQLQQIIDSKIPNHLIRIIQYLTKITTSKLLTGKTSSVAGATTGLHALIGAMKKITSNSFISPSAPAVVSATASVSSHSSTAEAVSSILSSVFHSFAYSTISALHNLFRCAEQNQLNQMILDDNLKVIPTIVEFVCKTGCFFLPPAKGASSSSGSTISPQYFPSFLVKLISIVEVFFLFLFFSFFFLFFFFFFFFFLFFFFFFFLFL
jgi:hypothetical protein